ncbi:MAG: class I SAM-dependent methyltransferase [Ignavibacteria bacterium]|nr:class I SAM-dependent methyltransferase [Ignavibacteria bacterium]
MADNNTNREMRNQWNELARINPFYAIDSVPEFESVEKADINTFFARGREDVDKFMKDMDITQSNEKTIVEIGCGMGRMSNSFSEYFKKVIAVDVSDEMLKKASEICKKTNVEFRKTDGDNLSFIPNESVDVVFSFIVFQHIIDTASIFNYIRDMSRVLKMDGIAYFQLRTFIPDFAEDITIKKIIKRKIKSIISRDTSNGGKRDDNAGNLENQFANNFSVWKGSRVDISDLLIFLKQQKFEIISIKGVDTQYTFFKVRKAS